jgi:hypothetical protein
MVRARRLEGGGGEEEGDTRMEEGYLKVLKRCCQCMKGCTEGEYRQVEKRIHPLFRSLNTAALHPYLPSLLSLAATLLPSARSVTPSLSMALSHQLTTFDITQSLPCPRLITLCLVHGRDYFKENSVVLKAVSETVAKVATTTYSKIVERDEVNRAV